MLLCPVRACHLPLANEGRRRVCARGHSFDISRSGYTNLLQPQERRSKHPGDTTEAVAARRRLHDRGLAQPLLQAIGDIAAPLAGEHVLDAGCGEGFYLGSLAIKTGCSGHGVDISTGAIDAAARRYPACEWIVANADRFVPWDEHSFSLVLSITARMNPGEFHRVLRPDGRLLMALPSPEDLKELRGAGRDRVERTLEAFAPHFTLAEQRQVTAVFPLDSEAVRDVLVSIYRPMQSQPAAAMEITLSLDLLLFHPKP